MSRFPVGKEPLCPQCGIQKMRRRGSERCQKCAQRPGWHVSPPDVPPMHVTTVAQRAPLADDLPTALKTPRTLSELATKCAVTQGQVLDGLLALKAKGVNV